MHELGLTQEVVDAISARVGAAKVTRVVLEVGRLSGVLPDAVRACLDLCTEGTPMEFATVEIVERPGIATCRQCGAQVLLESFFGYCPCGSSDLDWQSGDEVKVLEIEVAAEP